MALYTTMIPFFTPRRVKEYVRFRSMELLTRVLCLLTLINARKYNEFDFQTSKVGLLHKESIYCYTVIFLWSRQVTAGHARSR